MTEKQKKVRKYNVGKAMIQTMSTANLDTISELYERFPNTNRRRNVRTHNKRL